MQVLTFSSSNSSTSINRQLIAYATSLCNNAQMIDLRDFDCPIYSPDLEKNSGAPEAIKKLHSHIEKADTLIIGLNEHNGYPSAFFKNILDWLTRVNHQFLAHKSVILISSSVGKNGGINSLKHMQLTLPVFGANIIASFSVGSFNEVFKDNQLIDQDLNLKLNNALNQLK